MLASCSDFTTGTQSHTTFPPTNIAHCLGLNALNLSILRHYIHTNTDYVGETRSYFIGKKFFFCFPPSDVLANTCDIASDSI